MRVLERVGNLGNDVGGGVERDALGIFQHLVQRASLEQFHRDVGRFALLADVENRHDVRVAEPTRGARFAQEADADLVDHVLRQVRQQSLQRDLALEDEIDRAVNHPHGTPAQLSQDAITAKHLLSHLPAFPSLPQHQ